MGQYRFEGRPEEKRLGKLEYIKPGETRDFNVVIDIPASIAAVIRGNSGKMWRDIVYHFISLVFIYSPGVSPVIFLKVIKK